MSISPVTDSTSEGVLRTVHNDYYVLEHIQYLLRKAGVGRALWKYLFKARLRSPYDIQSIYFLLNVWNIYVFMLSEDCLSTSTPHEYK